MKFTGQQKHDEINVNVTYRDVHQDSELTGLFVEAIKKLAQAVGAARVKDLSREPEAKRWAKEFVVGYGLLAIGEARSMLLLFSDGLNMHARVHLRSLWERWPRIIRQPCK